MSADPPSPLRHFPVIRVFVSSTFSDLVAERNALAENVWPELERYCRQRGFTFQAIDLRWGVPSEAGLDHRTMQICFEELHRAQETSPEPNFLILLGDKYGWRPLPEMISEVEYARLFEHALSPEEQDTLAAWYRRDGNARPPHHVLRARTDSPDGQDYTRAPDADGRLCDTATWLAVQETLWAIVNRAYPGSLLPQRFAQGTDEMAASVRFQGSATEQEIWHGALRVEDARKHVVAWFRDIDRTDGDPEPSQLKRFMDLRPDQSPDEEAAAAIAELKTQVEEKLAPEPFLHARCRWETDSSGAFTGELTTDHLAPMCETILTRLRALILRQINDYWGADLSAEEATVAVVRGTPQELDLELRDHLRFAQERGPVDGIVGRDAQVRSIRDYLQADTNRPLIVFGPSGSGKTALLAYVAQKPFLPGAEAGGMSPLILTRFIGAHPESSTLRGMMTSLCRELRVHFPIAEPLPDTLQKLIEEFYARLRRATAEQPIYVFLDALDQLEATDQARECLWLHSQILPQTGESPCHARIVASCLSPSEEFPLETEDCEPFRRLQSRGLMSGDELGALSETAACKLLRQWLVIQERSLTEEQWKQVDAALRGSSACRQPLYLRVLHVQLRGWREFDNPTTLPASLPLLIQETLTRLCQPNQHGPLPRIALGYLVSARYGLAEGELLEILFRDSEVQAQLKAAAQAYGHHLPPGAKRYPIAPWARLRSDLRAYLSERAAPGTTVLSCYHRQVEQAVRTLFLADEATRTERRRLLADYFDDRWDQPDAHALMELPDLLLALPEHQRLYERLTDFAYPMRKAEVGLLEAISNDYTRLSDEGPVDKRAMLRVWQDFFREQGHILRRGGASQTVHKILLQLALDHADDSPVTSAAEMWLSAGRCDWLRLQRVPRLEFLTQNPCFAVFEGHTKGIRGALLLPNGRILSWSGGYRSSDTLRLWDAATGGCLAILKGHTDGVGGAMVLPEGRILSWAGAPLSPSSDTTLRVWDAATVACLAVLEGHTDGILGALVLPDGRILSWGEDTTLRLWDAATGACLAILEGHTEMVRGALVQPEGRILSWGDKTMRLWDVATGACKAVLKGHARNVTGALALQGGRVLSTSYDKTLRLWDVGTGACLAVLEGHTDGVLGALALPDGRILSWSGDKTLRLWDAAIGACRAVLEGHTDWVWDALLLQDGRILSSGDTTLRLWDAATGACLAVLKGHVPRVTGALAMPDGRILSWADRMLRMWDTTSGACLAVLEGHADEVVGAMALPDGRILSWGDTLRVWDATTEAVRNDQEGHTKTVTGAMALPDDRILSWAGDKTMRLWDVATGACKAVLKGHARNVTGALALQGGRILSWAGGMSEDTTLRVWDAATGTCLAVTQAHEWPVKGALALPDGRILSWSGEKRLRLWDTASGACLAVLEGHKNGVEGALTLPEGRILSWSLDGTLRVWDAVTGACYAALEGHTEGVRDVTALPDGRFLSWSFDKTLRVWDTVTGACLAVLEGHVGWIEGALELPDGRILSWSWNELRLWDVVNWTCLTVLEGHRYGVEGALALPDGRLLSWSAENFRLWNNTTGVCLETIPESDFPVRHPRLFHYKQSIEQPKSVVGDWRAEGSGSTALLYHRIRFTPFLEWQAESDCEARLLQPDGTLVVTQDNGQVCILKLHYGNRRVSLAEAEEILRTAKKEPQ